MDLHDKPFDSGTITKLNLFEKYTEEWLPTFIMPQRNQKSLWIFDFFAGPGYHEGIEGSPIRILKQIKRQLPHILDQQNLSINVLFNEKDHDKYLHLKKSCNDYIIQDDGLKNVQEHKILNIHIKNCDFTEIFPQYENIINNHPSLVFLDQNGIKFIAEPYFNALVNSQMTDFLYYISTSYIRRFADTPEFQKYIDVDPEKVKETPYNFIHKFLLDHLRSKLPKDSSMRLYPFSIKKNSNIYGIIFGSSHARGAEKFLKTAWSMNKVNGEANFDIDDDASKGQLLIFEDKQLTKIEKFRRSLRDKILCGEIKTNEDAFNFVLDQGHIPTHAADEIKAMKKDGLISYDGASPLVTYKQVYQDKRIIEYKVLSR